MRGFVPREILDKAFKMERVNVPTAPSLNLLLEEVINQYFKIIFFLNLSDDY
jgi:hypothetical protein